MFDLYTLSFWGILIAIFTLIIQTNIAGMTKAKQPGAIPGKINESLSHESFVFRTHRTFHNSLETFPAFISSAFLAIFCGAQPLLTAIFIWVFAIARLVHMALYYVIATEKNPSPRTKFYLIASIANIALLVLSAMALA